MRCQTARTWIIANRDGELTARQQRAFDRHLGGCSACRAERAPIEMLLATLDGLEMDAPVSARLGHDVLRRVRTLGAEAGAPGQIAEWIGRLVPALVATAVLVVAVVGIRMPAPRGNDLPTRPRTRVAAATTPAGITMVRRPKGRVPDEPPPELASRPDLFVDLPFLRELDKLRHFDSIATMEESYPPAPVAGPEPSNG